MQKFDVPEPGQDEKQHSQRLVELIQQRIEADGGWIDFAQYMQMALYQPGLGYYSAGIQKFGESGDFITAPELSPLFAQTLANPVGQLLVDMQGGDIIEFGAGSGRLAATLLAQLQQLDQLPDHYYIVELSADLKQRQQQTLSQALPAMMPRIHWLDRLPEALDKVVVIANEVLDAMPVQRFVKTGGQAFNLGVSVQDQQLVLQSRQANDELLAEINNIERTIGSQLPEEYSSEINLNFRPWLNALASVFQQGAVYMIDYGYPAAEYYLPERSMGTLMCYYRHRSHSDALWYPGIQDITAFVDFTALADAAIDAGMEVEGFTSQGNFLLQSGMSQLVEHQISEDIKQQLKLVQQVKTLTLPSEMGERFKVMGLSKNLPVSMPGFYPRDYRGRL